MTRPPIATVIGLAVVSALAQAAPADEAVMNLWPEGVPGLRADATPELYVDERISNVHAPTLTVFPAPAAIAWGTAVIVCPGGAYARLSWVKEGVEPARWLNSLGVTAFVLKYRMAEYGHPAPLRDVLRAVRTVRAHAAHYVT